MLPATSYVTPQAADLLAQARVQVGVLGRERQRRNLGQLLRALLPRAHLRAAGEHSANTPGRITHMHHSHMHTHDDTDPMRACSVCNALQSQEALHGSIRWHALEERQRGAGACRSLYQQAREQ